MTVSGSKSKTSISKSRGSVKKIFDRKFGEEFLKQVPTGPGIYTYFNAQGDVCYVGKAKSLRKRLGQYRSAKPGKAHRKMRSIVMSASKLEYVVCSDEEDALVQETRLIQEHRPKWNVVGAYSFLYPCFGVRQDADGCLEFLYTTLPDRFPQFSLHGAYRARRFCLDVYGTLVKLLNYWGHIERKTSIQAGRGRVKYSHVSRFRQLPAECFSLWEKFFRGDSDEALEILCFNLLENAGARRDSLEIQEGLTVLREFWNVEVLPLKRARDSSGYGEYPVPQRERDVIFVRAKFATPGTDL